MLFLPSKIRNGPRLVFGSDTIWGHDPKQNLDRHFDPLTISSISTTLFFKISFGRFKTFFLTAAIIRQVNTFNSYFKTISKETCSYNIRDTCSDLITFSTVSCVLQ